MWLIIEEVVCRKFDNRTKAFEFDKKVNFAQEHPEHRYLNV